MALLKKLLFAPFFLGFFFLLNQMLYPLLGNYDQFFSLDIRVLVTIVLVSAVLLVSAMLFIIFVALAGSATITVPVIILASLIPIGASIFGSGASSVPNIVFYSLSLGYFLCFLILLFFVQNSLKNYLSFQPGTIFTPLVKNLTKILILVISGAYFVSMQTIIQQQGFQIPASLVDTMLNATAAYSQPDAIPAPELEGIPEDKLEQAKNDPELAKMYNLTPEELRAVLEDPKAFTQKKTREIAVTQLNTAINQYKPYIPILLAFLFFTTLISTAGLLGLLLSPIIMLLFYLIEQSGIIHFTTELREVKKMVV